MLLCVGGARCLASFGYYFGTVGCDRCAPRSCAKLETSARCHPSSLDRTGACSGAFREATPTPGSRRVGAPDEHARCAVPLAPGRACLLTTLFALPAGRVLTTLKAPDERAEATLPQVLPPLPAHGMRICPSSTEPAASRSSCSTSTPSRPCWAMMTGVSRLRSWCAPPRTHHCSPLGPPLCIGLTTSAETTRLGRGLGCRSRL